ncbi:unnamed protein product [Chironomus riparius]|uniref:Cilia- and flagella-associated protein 91 n=1 Tax=Chironomus riparius TaxID=315576 RepID=A0A9N9RLN2_9DIPT|nr:unnamed protein product [Chironomus riparius]
MSFRSHSVAPTRVFDHLFDPIYTTSDPKSLYKENCIALTRSAPIRVYPVYNSMFSELSYEERNCFAYQRNELPLHFKCNNSQNKKYYSVVGKERSNFFCNPINNCRRVNVGLMADKSIENRNNKEDKNVDSTFIQTLYRESSAQTKSWLPECFTKEITSDNIPEVVFVADIIESVSYPGIKEVEIVERARKRRMWETTLPPIKAQSEIPSRVAALEAFEWEEWIAREKDINECQQVRLKIVSDLIDKREEKYKTDTDLKIQNCKKRTLTERNHQKDLLIHKFQRSMRKIDISQRKDTMRDLKNDPVLLHYDKKSDYAIPKIQMKKVTNLKKQIQIENSIGVNKNRQELWIPKKPPHEIIRGVWNENYLKRLHETLKHFRHKKKYQKKFFEKNASVKNENISLSLLLQVTDDHDVKKYQNKMLMQKTIKGRAIQSMLQKGMKKIQDVIQETKETHSIASVKNIFPEEFCQQIDCQKEIMTKYNKLDSKLHKDLEKIQSSDERKLLNYFEKELNRLNIEKQAHALFLLAERERYRRESENFRGTSSEKEFKEDSITVYLENILLEGINRAFDDNSRDFIREMARNIDKKAEKKETFDKNDASLFIQLNNISDNLDTFEVNQKSITELLKSNILYEKMHTIKNNKLASLQKQYLINAHYSLYTEEYEHFKKGEVLFLCSSIFNEILENATLVSFKRKSDKKVCLRKQSEEAEYLAAIIVEDILYSIIDNEENDELNKSYDNWNEDVDSKSEFQTKIINDDLLAEVITQDILKNAILSSSSSEKSEKSDF